MVTSIISIADIINGLPCLKIVHKTVISVQTTKFTLPFPRYKTKTLANQVKLNVPCVCTSHKPQAYNLFDIIYSNRTHEGFHDWVVTCEIL